MGGDIGDVIGDNCMPNSVQEIRHSGHSLGINLDWCAFSNRRVMDGKRADSRDNILAETKPRGSMQQHLPNIQRQHKL